MLLDRPSYAVSEAGAAFMPERRLERHEALLALSATLPDDMAGAPSNEVAAAFAPIERPPTPGPDHFASIASNAFTHHGSKRLMPLEKPGSENCCVRTALSGRWSQTKVRTTPANPSRHCIRFPAILSPRPCSMVMSAPLFRGSISAVMLARSIRNCRRPGRCRTLETQSWTQYRASHFCRARRGIRAHAQLTGPGTSSC